MIRFLYDNKWDGGTVTVGSQDANFLVTNTQHRWWQKTWRSAPPVEICYLVNDLGAIYPVNVVALKYNNFTPAADINIYGDIDIAFSPPEYTDHLLTISNDIMVLYLATTQTLYQYWMLKVDDATAPVYHELGRVGLGIYWSPGRNFAPGGGLIDHDDLSIVSRGEQGHLSALIQTNLKMFRYTFQWMSAADVATIRAMYEMHRTVGGFFFTENHAAPNTTTYYVRFYEKPQITPEMVGFSTVTITLVESM